MKNKGIIFDWIGTLAKDSNEIFSYSGKVIKKLSEKYKMSVVSIAGFGIEKRRKEIERSGFVQYFDYIIVDEYKDDKQFLEGMIEMGTTPQTTIIVDDRVVKGIAIGNKMVCQTFWVRSGKYMNETPTKETGEPTKIINSVEDLLAIL